MMKWFFLFNKDDFSIPGVPNAFGLPPSPYNFARPRKRPLSSSSPTIIEKDGQVIAVAGASGGSMITTATLQVLIRMLDFGEDANEAVEAPRFHHQLIPNTVWAEFELDSDLVAGLSKRGHNIGISPQGVTVTGVSAIKRLSNGVIVGSGDYRKGGDASAY